MARYDNSVWSSEVSLAQAARARLGNTLRYLLASYGSHVGQPDSASCKCGYTRYATCRAEMWIYTGGVEPTVTWPYIIHWILTRRSLNDDPNPNCCLYARRVLRKWTTSEQLEPLLGKMKIWNKKKKTREIYRDYFRQSVAIWSIWDDYLLSRWSKYLFDIRDMFVVYMFNYTFVHLLSLYV